MLFKFSDYLKHVKYLKVFIISAKGDNNSTKNSNRSRN